MSNQDIVNDFERDLDLADLALAVWQERGVFLAVLAVCIALAIAVAFALTPYYRAEVLVSAASEEQVPAFPTGGALLGLASLAGLGSPAKTSTTVALATLQSKLFIRKFIDDNNLMPVLFADIWDPVNKTWEVEDEKKVPTYWDAYELFDEKILQIVTDPDTGLITVAVEWPDPKIAAQWANDLVRRLNREMRLQKITESQRNLEYLRDQLDKMSIEGIRATIFSLMEDEIKTTMLARSREEFAFKVIDPALPPDKPVRPRKAFIAFGGGVLGGMLGLFAVFLRRRFAGVEPDKEPGSRSSD